jgi:hypothetical protein
MERKHLKEAWQASGPSSFSVPPAPSAGQADRGSRGEEKHNRTLCIHVWIQAAAAENIFQKQNLNFFS